MNRRPIDYELVALFSLQISESHIDIGPLRFTPPRARSTAWLPVLFVGPKKVEVWIESLPWSVFRVVPLGLDVLNMKM